MQVLVLRRAQCVFVASCLSLLLAACAGTTSLAPTDNPGGGDSSASTTVGANSAPYKVGQRIKVGDKQYFTVKAVKLWAGDQFIKPAAGKRYVAAQVLIEGIADASSYNPFFFSVKDADGFEYNVNAFGPDPQLQSGNDLAAGDKVAGWVAFELPTTLKLVTLVYQPDFFGIDQAVRVTLAVPAK
jgi:hypothetical protein